jgi:hypothetical protein
MACPALIVTFVVLVKVDAPIVIVATGIPGFAGGLVGVGAVVAVTVGVSVGVAVAMATGDGLDPPASHAASATITTTHSATSPHFPPLTNALPLHPHTRQPCSMPRSHGVAVLSRRTPFDYYNGMEHG